MNVFILGAPDPLPCRPLHHLPALSIKIEHPLPPSPPAAHTPNPHIPHAPTYRFFTSVAHPSIPSPRLPIETSTPIPSIPLVPSRNGLLLIPPAFARFAGSNSSIGVRNSPIRLASSMLKWYFSLNTSGSAQLRSRWMLRSSPLRLKISWDHLPLRQSVRGNGPRSSII